MVATPLLACGGGGADEESSAANVLVDAGLNFPVGRGAECSDGLDNDGDGLIDAPADPGCESALDSSELDEVKPQCADDIDNDGDGLIDYGPDPGCDDFQDNDETDPIVLQCNDGIDNDGDGLIDTQDPGCPVQQDNDESDDPSLPACSDGVDNDGDGDIDHPQDRGCSAPEDTDESGDMPLNAQPQCADGVDNDGDGLVDVADQDAGVRLHHAKMIRALPLNVPMASTMMTTSLSIFPTTQGVTPRVMTKKSAVILNQPAVIGSTTTTMGSLIFPRIRGVRGPATVTSWI